MADQTLAQAGPVVSADTEKQDQTATAEMPLVAISILNWNGWEDTLECLESVRQLDYPNYLTVVVDNGSTNGSADKIKAWAEENLGPGHVIADYTRETALDGGIPETEQALDRAASSARMVLIRNEDNHGFTGGNNVSIHYALQRGVSASFVMTLNNDASLAHDCLSQLVSVARRTGAGIVTAEVFIDPSGKVRSPAAFNTATRCLFHPLVKPSRPRPRTDTDFIWAYSSHGGAAMISREALLEIFRSRGEYMSSRLFMYLDEFELHFQAEKHGYKAALATEAFAFHKGGRSSNDNNLRVSYYRERNKILVANEVLSFRLRVLFHAFNILQLPIRAAKWTARGELPMMKTILAGQMDGYRGIGGKWKYHDQAHRSSFSR